MVDSLPSCTITIFLSLLHTLQEDPQKQHFRHMMKKVTIDTTASVIIELRMALYWCGGMVVSLDKAERERLQRLNSVRVLAFLSSLPSIKMDDSPLSDM